MKKVKITSKTYDDAVSKAIMELQTSSDNLNIEVINEGSEGFLGVFGKKPWVIIASVKESNDFEDSIEEIKKEDKVDKVDTKLEIKSDIEKTIVEEKSETVEEVNNIEKEENVVLVDKKEIENIDEIIDIANDFLSQIFANMQMTIKCETVFEKNDNTLNINLVSDDDMGLIIGKRGQTLDSLQYLVSLVINKNTSSFVRVKLDTEDYRNRRTEKLEILAKNIASKVKKTKRPVVLEPMNPYERRIIHSALQGDHLVTTISEGEDPYRHITVLPRHKKNNGYKKRYNNKND